MFDQDQYSLTFVSSFLTLFKLSDGAGAVWNYSQLQTEAMYDWSQHFSGDGATSMSLQLPQ